MMVRGQEGGLLVFVLSHTKAKLIHKHLFELQVVGREKQKQKFPAIKGRSMFTNDKIPIISNLRYQHLIDIAFICSAL